MLEHVPPRCKGRREPAFVLSCQKLFSSAFNPDQAWCLETRSQARTWGASPRSPSPPSEGVGVNTHTPIRHTQDGAHKTKRVLKLLAVLLPSAALAAYLRRFYFAREFFVFVVLAALLVFAGATLVAIGLLLQEGKRSVVRYIRKSNLSIARQPEIRSPVVGGSDR